LFNPPVFSRVKLKIKEDTKSELLETVKEYLLYAGCITCLLPKNSIRALTGKQRHQYNEQLNTDQHKGQQLLHYTLVQQTTDTAQVNGNDKITTQVLSNIVNCKHN